MALLSASRKLCLTFTRQAKVNSSKFHTLIKTDSKLITRKIPTEILTPKRTFFWIFKRKTKREIRLVDKPPNHYELIYRCSVDHYFLTFQHLGFYSIVTVCLITIYLGQSSYHLPPKKQEFLGEDGMSGKKISKDENEAMLFVSSFILIFCGLQLVLGRMPMRVYCYPQAQKYLLCFYGPIPNQLRTLKLKAGDLKPKSGGMLASVNPWSSDGYEHKKTGQRFVLVEEYFRYPGDLYIMLGWQKDPNINYDYEDKDKKSKSSKLDDK